MGKGYIRTEIEIEPGVSVISAPIPVEIIEIVIDKGEIHG